MTKRIVIYFMACLCCLFSGCSTSPQEQTAQESFIKRLKHLDNPGNPDNAFIYRFKEKGELMQQTQFRYNKETGVVHIEDIYKGEHFEYMYDGLTYYSGDKSYYQKIGEIWYKRKGDDLLMLYPQVLPSLSNNQLISYIDSLESSRFYYIGNDIAFSAENDSDLLSFNRFGKYYLYPGDDEEAYWQEVDDNRDDEIHKSDSDGNPFYVKYLFEGGNFVIEGYSFRLEYEPQSTNEGGISLPEHFVDETIE